MALKLPRFLRDFALIDLKTGYPTSTFIQWWNDVLKQIEASVNSITAALEAADIAVAAAEVAQAAADQASNVGKLTSSGMSGLTLTATDAGSDVTITISSHTRVYGDGASVPVTGGTLTGRLYSTTYYIYYDDPAFAGGTVSYQSTTDMSTAAQTGSRHLVGAVNTPAALGAPSNGAGPRPPGFDFEQP